LIPNREKPNEVFTTTQAPDESLHLPAYSTDCPVAMDVKLGSITFCPLCNPSACKVIIIAIVPEDTVAACAPSSGIPFELINILTEIRDLATGENLSERTFYSLKWR